MTKLEANFRNFGDASENNEKFIIFLQRVHTEMGVEETQVGCFKNNKNKVNYGVIKR